MNLRDMPGISGAVAVGLAAEEALQNPKSPPVKIPVKL